MIEDSPQEFLTIAEAASQFGVPQRRIRHVLERSVKQGANVPQTRQKTFRTKTGERSAVAYSAAWLRECLEGKELDKGIEERSENIPRKHSANEAEHSSERSVAESTERFDWKARDLVAEARAELLEAERDKLQARIEQDSERLGEALRALAQAQDETRAARLIGVRASVGLIEPGLRPAEASYGASGGDSTQGSVSEGESIAQTPQTTQEPKKRGWWRTLADSFTGRT